MKRGLVILVLQISIKIFACTGIFVTNENVKIFGLNEDFYNYNTYYATVPASGTNYGLLGFGHSNSIQAIINEEGLCYDGYGAPHQDLQNPNNLPVNNNFVFDALRTCSSVSEVEELFNQYYHPWLSDGQAFFVDRFGNSAIFEGEEIIHKTGLYQICTNFYQSNPESGIPYGFYPCWRYDFIEDEVANIENYSVELITSLLDSVHVENQVCPNGLNSTLYSLVIDLNSLNVHVYNLHDYSSSLILNIDEELSKPAQNISLAQLFTTSVVQNDIPHLLSNIECYPNPFTPKNQAKSQGIRLKYHLEDNCKVSINIYDIRGRLVKKISESENKAGDNIAIWDGKNDYKDNVPSGLYLYKISTPNQQESGKIMIIK